MVKAIWNGAVLVSGETNRDAAGYYAEPKPAAAQFEGYVAFWRGIKVAA